jgi:hypothetical protein
MAADLSLDEQLRVVLMEIVSSAGSLPPDQRRTILMELQKVDIKSNEVREQLKVSFGAETFDNALRSARQRIQGDTIEPAIFCSGGKIDGFCGIDLQREQRILKNLILEKESRDESRRIVTRDYVKERLNIENDDMAVYVGQVANSVINKVLKEFIWFTRNTVQGDSQTDERSHVWCLLKSVEIAIIPGPLRQRFETRIHNALQARILGS